MENVVLIIHLLLALALIGVVLMQRSEGGGLGMGSSGGGPSTAGRSAATALGKLTWGLAAAFICTSIFLTVLAAENSAGTSVIDRAGLPTGDAGDTDGAASTPALPSAEDLLPPSSDDTAPLVPKAD
ncbi:MAG: preprotein translocase subunit SecG [Rhodobacteraceae bacterium]|nr:preprotein translocase subunit SecG [Paracoccaceae bacterium]